MVRDIDLKGFIMFWLFELFQEKLSIRKKFFMKLPKR